MEKLSFEELEAQHAELLPDRIELHHRRRRRGVRVTQVVFVANANTNLAAGEDILIGNEFD